MENQNFPKRKPTRLTEFDYSTPGAYFVTICTHEKAKILSTVVNETTGGGTPPLQPRFEIPENLVGEAFRLPYRYEQIKTKLTKYGEIVEKYTQLISEKYPETIVEKYVIMPNHIHMIISINISGTSTSLNGTSRTPSPTNSLLSQFISTFKRYCNSKYGKNIWQRSFHDHIIRTEKEHLEIYEYVENNPFTWENDCFY